MNKELLFQELFRQLYEANIQETKSIWNLAKEYDMENEQETLDWLDELNLISVQN